jgi:hypothetical protein
MGTVEIVALRKGGFRRLFARKRLRPELVADPRALQMLVEEGRIAGLLRHPNVVHVLDVGVDGEGPYLIMELVRGLPASELLRHARTTQRPLDLQMVMRLVEQAASGLHAAHELCGDDGAPLGIVHRDVSPQNLLVGFDGVTRVTDFGIAKALDVETHTTTGLLKGKAGYMSPEQLRFETIDRRADLFSLGIVLFELATGRRLYRDENAALSARRILHEAPPDLGAERPEAPTGLAELSFELLAKDPSDRPRSAKEVATRLAELVAEDVVARGAFDVEGYLAAEFPERLAETKRWSQLAEESSAAAAPERATARGAAGPSGAHRPARWVVAMLAVGLVAALGVGAWSLGGGGAPAASAPAPAAAPTPVEVAAPEPPAPVPAPPAAEVPAPAGEVEPRGATREPARRRRRRTIEPAAPEPAGEVW